MKRLALVAVLALAACAATASEMTRAEQAYDDARFDHARTWLVELEPRAPGMPPPMRARYHYLRGMSEYRLGHRLDALHHLEIAKEIVEQQAGSALRDEQRELLTRTLTELEPTAPLEHRPPPAPGE